MTAKIFSLSTRTEWIPTMNGQKRSIFRNETSLKIYVISSLLLISPVTIGGPWLLILYCLIAKSLDLSLLSLKRPI